MKWRKQTYVLHRWIGLLVSVQLLAWSVSGFLFSVLDIEGVRGELDASAVVIRPIEFDRVLISATDAVARAIEADAAPVEIGAVRLVDRSIGAFYELDDASGQTVVRVDAATGAVRSMIAPEEAIAIAQSDFLHDAAPIRVHLIENDPPLEYRDKPLPAYRVELDHLKEPHIYVNAVTGEVTARRNAVWRLFDFFWMLHIMDYDERSDFNHWVLSSFSALAIVTAASGLALWGWRIIPRPRRATIRTGIR